MCGILSVFCNKSPQDKDLIYKCADDTLTGRGPDCHTVLQHHEALLFFYRLCIVDPSPSGNQPFVSNDIAVMCNGEIYNHLELETKYELKCESRSDCEVILRLYEKLRNFAEVVKLLDGVYAITLVDKNHCWFTRDRIGVRPLFSGFTRDGYLAVASLAKTLLPFCKNVRPVLPGFIYYYNKLLFPNMKWVYKKILYLNNWTPSISMLTYDETCIRLRSLLTNSVQKRLMADRPLACLLSGGLDSSLITAILCKLIGPQNVRTYSIGMKGSIDLAYANKVSQYLGTQHTEILFSPQEGLEAIERVIYDTETYDVTTIRASVPMWLLSRWISSNTPDTVIFSGEGSDELFCGYLYFHNAPSTTDASEESKRLLQQLYIYDVLRADRAVSSHGLELRVPFLDKSILEFSLTLPDMFKAPIDKWEKKLLRDSFTGYLPDEVLWRRKNGMSDAVGTVAKPWYQYIAEHVDTRIGDELYDDSTYMNKEAMYYKLIFNKLFPLYNLKIDMWMPRWSGDLKNPSGMLIDAFDEKDIVVKS